MVYAEDVLLILRSLDDVALLHECQEADHDLCRLEDLPEVAFANVKRKLLSSYMVWFHQQDTLEESPALHLTGEASLETERAKKDVPPLEKPEAKTHLRDMVIISEMVGSMVGVYNDKTFNQVEVKPEMIGHYLGEFSMTYKPVKHGRPGIGSKISVHMP
uniref:40S ribosomal protein S15 n=1 Tax=Petromyzon marinus TaxID=7757 RepID=A0AAJ7XJW3_PETMA|nr:30S ribosomal protein S19, chloroplastic-like [Petromyzon marinus]